MSGLVSPDANPNPRPPGDKMLPEVWVGGPLKTTTTTPYLNPDVMVHMLLTLNEPLAAA